MLATDGGCRLHVGLPGHGKTHLIRQEAFGFARAHPLIVVDPTWEWSREPGNRVPAELRGVAASARDVAEAAAMVDGGARLVVISTDDDLAAVADAALRWARYFPGLAGVAVSEAHNAFPVHRPLSKHAQVAVTAWRHWGIALWADTQRLALVNRSLDLSRVVRVFSAVDADASRLREIGGAGLVSAVRDCGTRNAPKEHGGWGQPGWHVELFEGVRPRKFVPVRR